jgi:hypothetical protein
MSPSTGIASAGDVNGNQRLLIEESSVIKVRCTNAEQEISPSELTHMREAILLVLRLLCLSQILQDFDCNIQALVLIQYQGYLSQRLSGCALQSHLTSVIYSSQMVPIS